MEASCFDVDAFVFVETNASIPLRPKEILVPERFLKYKDVSSIIALKQQDPHSERTKKIPVLSTLTVDLGDYKLLDSDLPPRLIFAHAVAERQLDNRGISLGTGATKGEKKMMDYETGDKFFLVNTHNIHQEHSQGKYDAAIEVLNLSTGEVGFVPAACLIFYPHAKVVEEFEWTTPIGGKMLNRIGDLVSIGHGIKALNFGQVTMNYPIAFGRNRTTCYWGFIPIPKIVGLSPEELENWTRSTLLPVHSQGRSLRQHKSAPSSLPGILHTPESSSSVGGVASIRYSSSPEPPEFSHSDPETCYCQENFDVVAEFKRNNRLPDTPGAPQWRRRGPSDPYNIEQEFGIEGRADRQMFNLGMGSSSGSGGVNGNRFSAEQLNSFNYCFGD